MTDQRDKARTIPAETAADVAATAAGVSISRRTLLRGASIATPAILTLNSNAAFGWAITSGTIGTRSPTTAQENATCLVGGEAVDPIAKPGVYYADVGDFEEVRSDLLYSLTDDGNQPLSPSEVCEQTGSVYYSKDQGGTWSPVEAPGVQYGGGGAVVSFAALDATSFHPGDIPLWPYV